MKRLLLVLLAIVAAALAVVWIIGLLLPVEHVASQSRWYAAPRDTLWNLVTDVRGYAAWRQDLDSVTVLERPMGWREYGSFGAVTFTAELSDPRERFVSRIADPDLGYGGRWIYSFADSAGGTRLTITEEGEITNAFFRTMSRFVMGYEATMRQYLDDLERRIAGNRDSRIGNR
jgi:hypothetical protein